MISIKWVLFPQHVGQDFLAESFKFLWMIRIAEGVWPNEVKERDFFTPRGEYKVDAQATETMKKSLM
jgi:hypothetical protein